MGNLHATAAAGAAGRYAPSPSGELHIGNLRTALIAWLSARSRGAPFLLRIEDLDRDRCRADHERSQIADLGALGLDWDGTPMRQSERTAQYRAAFEQLRAAGRAYPCWCTRADIAEAAAAPHGAPGVRRYPGTCRLLGAAERGRRLRQDGAIPAWRLDGRGERVRFRDLLHGAVDGVVEDVVLWRADEAPAYNLAVVVDDGAQAIGEVVRGDDLLSATPAQISLIRLLGLAQPAYLHVPLVVGPTGRRLAKRDGAVTLAQRLAAGETTEQIIAWLALSAGLVGAGEPVALEALLSSFRPQRLARAPAVLPPPGSLR